MRRSHSTLAQILVLVLALGCGGDGSTTAPDPSGSVSISVAPSSGAIEAGSAGTVAVSITRGGGFAASVALTVEGAPSGVSVSLSSGSLAGGASSADLDITVAESVTPGAYPLTVRASGSGVAEASATYILTVTPAPEADFDVEVSQTTFTIEEGDSATAAVVVQRIGAFTGEVGLFVTGAPTNVRAVVSPNSTADTIASLKISVAVGVAAGTYPLVLTASENGPRERQVNLTLVVTAKPAAGVLTVGLGSVAVTQTIPSDPIVVRLARAQGVTGPVDFSLEGLPGGFSGTFSPNPATGDSTLLVLTLTQLAPTGTNTITVRATVGGATATADLLVTSSTFVPPNFGLSVDPSVASVTAGSATSARVVIDRTNFSDSVSLVATGMPTGMTATLTPSATAGDSVTLDITTSVTVSPGVYPITVAGTADAIAGTRSAVLSLTVNAPSGGANVQWQFCDPARFPLWFGVRTGTTGAWTQVAATSSTGGESYGFAFDQAGQVAVVQNGTNGIGVTVFHTTPQQVLALAAEECASERPTKTISGRIVNGINSLRGASIVAGGAGTIIPAGGSNFTLPGVKEGLTDIIAYLGVPNGTEFSRFDRIIMRRDIDPTDGAVMADFDFAGSEWLFGVSANFTFRNVGGDMFTVARSYVTGNGNVGPLALYGPRNDSTLGLPGVPAAFRRPGDLHRVVATTTDASAPRSVVGYNTNFNSFPLEFGPLLDVPTVTVSGGGPVRLRAEGAWSSAYGSAVAASFVQPTGGVNARSMVLTASREFFGASATWALETPGFAGAPGFDAGWLIRPGVLTTHTVTGTGVGSGVSLTPADGTQIVTGSRVGTITP